MPAANRPGPAPPGIWHDAPVSVLFRYFSASADEDAARAINLPGGPGPPPSQQPPRRGWKPGRRTSAAVPEFDTALTGGLDPVVQMGTLEAQLTGRDYETVITGPRSGHIVASADGGQRLVIAVTDELRDALAAASDDTLRSAAGPWSQTEEFFGSGDPDILAGSLHELAELARRASTSNHRIYCWICV